MSGNKGRVTFVGLLELPLLCLVAGVLLILVSDLWTTHIHSPRDGTTERVHTFALWLLLSTEHALLDVSEELHGFPLLVRLLERLSQINHRL